MTVILAFLARLLRAAFSAWLARPDPVVASSREAGAAEADLSVARRALEAQWRVTQAAQSAPRSDAQIDDLLDKGEA
ncbi:MAG TPA: hypothetical protein VG407_12640 [Caulobacteraceae bacterium]|jgi:hypothetical protein|nr:hypothetical protein [Caulobacteraceae bacterium]